MSWSWYFIYLCSSVIQDIYLILKPICTAKAWQEKKNNPIKNKYLGRVDFLDHYICMSFKSFNCIAFVWTELSAPKKVTKTILGKLISLKYFGVISVEHRLRDRPYCFSAICCLATLKFWTVSSHSCLFIIMFYNCSWLSFVSMHWVIYHTCNSNMTEHSVGLTLQLVRKVF